MIGGYLDFKKGSRYRMTPYQKHKKKWGSCTSCDLCEQRSRVVLARGNIPCQLLFIGEAPGASEDVLGRPFCGPAGILLDRILKEAAKLAGFNALGTYPGAIRTKAGVVLTYAMVNLVACYPREAKKSGDNAPPLDAIQKCRSRLLEFVDMCQPKVLVTVGALAEKHTPNIDVKRRNIVHPAAILRADISQRSLAVKRCVVTIANAVAELTE